MKLPSDIHAEPQKRRPLHFILKIIGLLIGLALIAWFASKSDMSQIWTHLKTINVGFLLLIIITFGAYFTCSLAWHYSFHDNSEKVSIWRLFIIRLIGESLSQINPTNFIAGETMKAYLLKKSGVSYKNGIISLTISRFLIFLSSFTLILIGIFVFFNHLKALSGTTLIYIATAVIISIFALTIYLLQSNKGFFFIPVFFLNGIKQFIKKEKIETLIVHLKEMDGELIEFYNTKKINFAIAYFYSVIHWIIGAMEFYIILYLLGVNVTIFDCIAIEVGVMVFKALGAFIPGQIGVEEYGSKVMLDLVGVSGSGIWQTVAILRRTRQLFWIAIGFIAFYVVVRQKKEINNGSIIYNS